MPASACHTSPYSGSWYPAGSTQLDHLLDDLFDTSARRTGPFLLPDPVAFVVPHAGLIYSGRVAAAVYRHLRREQPRRIVLLGFSHHGAPSGLWIPDLEAFETPLGEIGVDRSTVRQLLETPEFRRMPEYRLCDHSVEIQLPLLQKAAPSAQIVPVYVSSLTSSSRERAAAVLAGLIGPGTVLIASSDFTHYGTAFRYQPFPHDENTPFRLRQLDTAVMDAAGSLRPELFCRALEHTSATVCGREPIALLLATIQALPTHEDIFQQKLDYETSGDITGDFGHCVSYAALGYFPWASFQLSEEDGALLLESARETLRRYQETGEVLPVPPERRTDALQRPGGAFVTLRDQHRLRGCVGRAEAPDPLWTLVPELTLAAASEDSRFEPVGPDEDIEIEISILSPMKRIIDRSQFRVERDGCYLKAADTSSLLLPQVAKGRNWTASQFFSALAQKGGAEAGVYDEPTTRLSVFRAQLIG